MSLADMAHDLQEPYACAEQYQEINTSGRRKRGEIIISSFKILRSQTALLKINFGDALCSYIYITRNNCSTSHQQDTGYPPFTMLIRLILSQVLFPIKFLYLSSCTFQGFFPFLPVVDFRESDCQAIAMQSKICQFRTAWQFTYL